MKLIDTLGMLCPAPLICTKKGLQEAASGETIEIRTDNETACSNLLNYLAELKLTPEISREGNVQILRLVKPETIEEAVNPASFCSTPAGDYVVAIRGDVMGAGEEALGRILLRAFINSLKEVDRLPSAIILYNSGVKVALQCTDTAVSLQELEERGVSIIACGTCVDYYELKEQMAVGMISNMYKITKLLSEAGHVIYP
ncbi:MAG: sulfurtransferase-like selenium metabolism protein YedF [Tannerellaceae bacterium]